MQKFNLKITSQYFFDLAFLIILFFFSIFMMTEIGFIFNIPVNYVYILISLIISGFYIYKKDVNYDKKLLIIPIVLSLVFSYLYARAFYDCSIDGRLYHLETVTLLKDGYTPIYNQPLALTLNDFPNAIIKAAGRYAYFYPKFCEIIGAHFVLVFKYLETTKMLNCMMFFQLFFISVFALSKFKNLSKGAIGAISLLICFNPVMLCQLISACTDGTFYALFCNFLFAIFLKNKVEDKDQKIVDIYFVMVLLMASNIKMTGLVYFVAFLASYYLYCRFMCKKEQYKNWLKIFVVSMGLMLITMINPYFTNLKDGNPIFYPLVGSPELNELQRLETATIYQYLEHGHLYRTFYGIFATPDRDMTWISINHHERMNLKLPFTIGPSKILFHPATDFCGFGYFWSGIIVLFLGYLLFNLKAAKEEKWLLIILFCSVFFNPSNHWSRYAPQFWLLPLLSIAIFLNDETITKAKKIFLYLFLGYILVNSLIVLNSNIRLGLDYTKQVNEVLYGKGNLYFYFDNLAQRPRRLWEFFIVESSILFEQLKERNIDYQIVTKEFYQKNWDKFYYAPYDMRKQTFWMRDDIKTDETVSYYNGELHYKD